MVNCLLVVRDGLKITMFLCFQETIQAQKRELSNVQGKQNVALESQRTELSQMREEIDQEKVTIEQ